MDHEAQSVLDLSKIPLLLVCWQGRQLMRASISFALDGGFPALFPTSTFDPDDGEREMSRWSHQSNSVTLCMPELVNHCLFPSGAKKWQLGWALAISLMVGYDR